MEDGMTENEISRPIVECAIEVHRTLGGPGLLEDVYEEAKDAKNSLKKLCVFASLRLCVEIGVGDVGQV
jgi:hypothetical protein